MNSRIQWLDVAKGITIILMVMGHSSIPNCLSDFIWTFHMPFFFIASGYTSKFNIGGYKTFVLKKLKTIMLPFVIYSLINIPLRSIVSDKSIVECAVDVLKNGWLGVALWFVPVLFMALLLAGATFQSNNKYMRQACFVIFPVISALLCKFKIYLPWDISAVPLAAFFVMVGQYFKLYDEKLAFIKQTKFLSLVICFAVTAIVSHFWRLDMCWNSVLPLLPKIIGAIAGAIMVAIMSVYIVTLLPICTKILTSVGKETFVILAFAQITIGLLNKFCCLNFVVKYALMAAILVVIVFVKRAVVSVAKTGKIRLV